MSPVVEAFPDRVRTLFDGIIADNAGVDAWVDIRIHKNDTTYTVYHYGDFGGGTFGLEVSPDHGVTWQLVFTPGATTTGRTDFQARGTHLRPFLLGSTNPDFTAKLAV